MSDGTAYPGHRDVPQMSDSHTGSSHWELSMDNLLDRLRNETTG